MEFAKHKKQWAMGGIIVLVLLTLGIWHFTPKTPGEQFREALRKIEKACASRHVGPNEQCGKVAKLKAADPLATPEGRFAHSIKLPEPLPEDSGYKRGMTPREYFDHLCQTEAGEFIYRTVDNVEGIFQLRPRDIATDVELSHLYALEDPYGHVDAEAQDTEFHFVRPNRYEYFERAVARDRAAGWGRDFLNESYFFLPRDQSTVVRYSGYDSRNTKTMKKGYDEERISRYGYTWRGIVRQNDREMGIAGGELIVLDLETQDVLGVRRGYMLLGKTRNHSQVSWNSGHVCPRYGFRAGRDKAFDFSYWFIGKVLRPTEFEKSFQELASGF